MRRARRAVHAAALEEGHRPRLDALARRGPRRRRRVDERGVRREARPSVGLRVVDLEDQRLVAPHLGEVEPAVARVVLQAIGLADAVRIAPLVAHDLPHALRPRPLGVVVVRRKHRLAHQLRLALGLVARAQGVVEHRHALRARELLHQLLELGVVDRLELPRVEEVLHRAGMIDEHEAVLVEREFLARRPAIADLHRVRPLAAARAPADVVRPEGLVDELLARVYGVDDLGGGHPLMLPEGAGSHSVNGGSRLAFIDENTVRLQTIPAERIASRIMLVRGSKVMLDSDLADLYGVPTGSLVQAVQRNRQRFPPDFMFQLTEQEVANLKSQSVTSSFVALGKWGGRRTLPYVFSEQGLAKKLDELDRRVSKHDDAITSIVRAIRELAMPSESKPKRRIGFVSEE